MNMFTINSTKHLLPANDHVKIIHEQSLFTPHNPVKLVTIILPISQKGSGGIESSNHFPKDQQPRNSGARIQTQIV